MGTFAVYRVPAIGERTITRTAAIFWMFEVVVVVVFEWTCVCRRRKGTCSRNICMKGSLITTVLSCPVLSERSCTTVSKTQLWVHTVQPVNPVSTLGLGMNAHPPNLLLIDRTEPLLSSHGSAC
jgi:hypothetical protein